MTTTAATSDLYTHARAHFPALSNSRPPTAFLDNAGGSQVPAVVAQAIHDYLLTSYVQLGADYEISRRATHTVARAHDFLKVFMNVPDLPGDARGSRRAGEVIMAASTSELANRLAAAYADAYADAFPPNSELILCETGHESNIGPWARLASRGHTIKLWRINPHTGEAPLPALESLLSPQTRIVAFPHVSNILGAIIDPRPIADLARRIAGPHVRIVCDGVAFAPHRAIDVAAFGVDYYLYSTYKVYGPHAAAMYASRTALADVTGPNHFYIHKDELPRKFELGGVSHEAAAGILALDHFLRDLTNTPRLPDLTDPSTPFDRAPIESAFAHIERLEVPLQDHLLAYLRSKPDVRIIGAATSDTPRVCTVSFTHARLSSREIALAANAENLAIRHGHFYAHRLCTALGLDPDDGVVRISLAHYNTPEELNRLTTLFDKIL